MNTPTKPLIGSLVGTVIGTLVSVTVIGVSLIQIQRLDVGGFHFAFGPAATEARKESDAHHKIRELRIEEERKHDALRTASKAVVDEIDRHKATTAKMLVDEAAARKSLADAQARLRPVEDQLRTLQSQVVTAERELKAAKTTIEEAVRFQAEKSKLEAELKQAQQAGERELAGLQSKLAELNSQRESLETIVRTLTGQKDEAVQRAVANAVCKIRRADAPYGLSGFQYVRDGVSLTRCNPCEGLPLGVTVLEATGSSWRTLGGEMFYPQAVDRTCR